MTHPVDVKKIFTLKR
ncbi:hypothetical protein SEUBUCD646_0K01850 [Saccharomyces eubayanus]|uniref:Uncharacterized protein n=1 Tax=Saccharomyces eubayanus TaxID=1080349 RepID=A0ABN8VEH0_SACEU|nr:hypothetical protein SEUBUCD650_0K01840 [Saccharomyces eubayanus]CAI1568961.1 hypothetical protein SEUBUCD646_0K01850 [Saccharomyces eubayanus]